MSNSDDEKTENTQLIPGEDQTGEVNLEEFDYKAEGFIDKTKSQVIAAIHKLPFLNKKSSEEDEYEEFEEDEESLEYEDAEEKSNKSILVKVKKAIAPLLEKLSKKNKTAESEEDDESDGDEPKEPRKKIPLKPIHIVIIIALGALLLAPDDEVPVDKKEVKVQKKKSQAQLDKEKKALAQKKSQVEDTTKKKDIITETEKKTAPEKSGESKKVEEKENLAEGKETETKENTADVTEEEPNIVSDISEATDEIKDENVDDLKNVKVEDEIGNVDFKLPETILETEKEKQEIAEEEERKKKAKEKQKKLTEDLMKIQSTEDEFVDLNTGKGAKDFTEEMLKELEDKMRSKTNQESMDFALEPVEAPNYENIGKALVYNCKGQYWACIDKDSYDNCDMNYRWNKSQKIDIECYPSQIYISDEDCSMAQQNKIDLVVETKFCNE